MSPELSRIIAKMMIAIKTIAENSSKDNLSEYETVDMIRARINEIAYEAMEYLN